MTEQTVPEGPGTETSGSRSVRRPDAATALTIGLAGVLLGAAALLGSSLPDAPLLEISSTIPAGVAVGALVVLLFLAELGQARIEIRRQAYSFSLAGAPLLLGVLFCPPALVVGARLLAAVAAFSLQRVPAVKFAFNAGAYAFDVTAVLVLCHLLVPDAGDLSPATAAACFVSLAVVDALMSAVVLAVIRLNGGPVGREDVVEVLLSAGLFVAINTAVGLIAALLLGAGSLGAALLVLVAGAAAACYRAYLVLRRRHRSLQDLQDFIRGGEGAHDVAGLADRLLPQVRELLHAGRAVLRVEGRDGVPATVHCVEDDDGRRPADTAEAPDRLQVPFDVSGTLGTLTVDDRLGDGTRFTPDDLALLRTLAGHLAVALHSVRLLERLRFEARHDALTGLPNRAQLTENLRELMTTAADDQRVSVLLLNLDRFKEVNDAFGHDMGDELLGVVAERLRTVVPAACTVGRLGGDDFAVVLPPTRDPETACIALASAIARVLAAPAHLSAAAVTTGACVGIAVATTGQGAADLLRHADTAMYAAKDTRIPVVVYTDALDDGRRERLGMLVDMRSALDNDEFELHYQPKVSIGSGVATSVEALIRWNHPVLGRIQPDAFIPVAESTGLIEELTQVVLLKALRQCREWRDAGHDLSVAVNLSARNINDPGLPDRVAAALRLSGVPAHRLILEITESSVMGDPERTVPTLERLAALGLTLSLDDFGTGYSSLSYLQRLPVRELKIDRSFLLGLERPDDARASAVLVRSIVGLGQSLGLTVVAEGVETREMYEHLRSLGCDVAQGYLISRPVPADRLTDAVHRAGFTTRRSASGGTGDAAWSTLPIPLAAPVRRPGR